MTKTCKYTTKGWGWTCGNLARKGKDFCWRHDGTPKKSERLEAENTKLKEELSEANIQIKQYQNEVTELEDKIEAYTSQGE